MSDLNSYSLSGYGNMLADSIRREAYTRALQQAIRPGDIVADIGTGPGYFAILACRFGARHVYAIEPSDLIALGPQLAEENGCADRITFIQDISTRITLPEPAQVIFSDLRGVLPLYEHHIPALADAYRRLLAPGGTLIPRRDTLWAGVVDAPELYAKNRAGWEGGEDDFQAAAVRRVLVNQWTRGRVSPEQFLAKPQPWATIDYGIREDPNARAELVWTSERDGIARGLLLWFDAELIEGVTYSTGPESPELIYGSAFFPFPEPIPLQTGDSITVTLRADFVDSDYLWSWNTLVRAQGDSGAVRANFRQSTWQGEVFSAQSLRGLETGHRPRLKEEGRIAQAVLAGMDGDTPLEVIAQRLTEQFPARFASRQKALAHASRLAQRYGQ